jgi:hypothetical protein
MTSPVIQLLFKAHSVDSTEDDYFFFVLYLMTEAQPATDMCVFLHNLDDRISEICVTSCNIVLAHILNILTMSQV